ncbi:30S ribosomal protein S15, partial [archaeon]|nr:30S ribosomal protein S15 [archaeon]
MARMHSRKKGKSSSTRPISKKKQNWLSYTSQEIEQIIIKLAKENSPSEIGL